MSLPCERDTARVTETLEVVSCERDVKETLAVSLSHGSDIAVSLCRTQVSFVGLFCIRDLHKRLLLYLSRTAVTSLTE